MSLRKFMHPRNKYKEEPNFKQLAVLYPEFRKVSIIDIAGRVRINFKDVESLKILTKTLLKHDFDLEVDIPPNNLVPALPLRLNYILWIEDLLKHGNIIDLSAVHGVDIGTGAICIYPILFSKIYKSKMTATDIDPDSIDSASKNIVKNNLQDLIKVVLVNKESILKEIVGENDNYSFIMCNPPFFKTDEGLGKKSKQEPPRNAPTGNENELQVKGGETEFILRLIQESIEHKDKVKIYTTMFGQKSSLGALRTQLFKNGILNSTWTEFCQGFTKRWGIAWTFLPKNVIDLTTAPIIRTRAEVLKIKKEKSMEIIFPAKEDLKCLEDVVSTLKKWINELEIQMKEIELEDEDSPCWVCQLTSYKNTWSHSRRKRRMAMRQEAMKKQCIENPESNNQPELIQAPEPADKIEEITEKTDPLLVCTLLVGEKDATDSNSDSDSEDSEDSEEETSETSKKLRICMLFESGHGGKLSLETLRQYFVNKLNIRAFFRKQNPSKPNKKKRKKKKSKKNSNRPIEIV